MSRHTLTNVIFTEDLVQKLNAEVPSFVLSDPYATSVAFGFDHTGMGYFIQVFSTVVRDGDFEEELSLDLDSMFNGLKGWQLGYLIRTIVEESQCGPLVHRQLDRLIGLAYMDLPL